MIKNKIKMLLNFKNVKQVDLIELLEMSSAQAINNKFAKNRFTLQDIIAICDKLDCTLKVVDNKTNKVIIDFEKEDI